LPPFVFHLLLMFFFSSFFLFLCYCLCLNLFLLFVDFFFSRVVCSFISNFHLFVQDHVYVHILKLLHLIQRLLHPT
jgi:hypothetical protein